jgi:hypothetical protein
MRTEYEMTDKQLSTLLDACKPAMFLSGGTPMFDSPQENANRAWAKLGDELGFDSTTVEPIPGKHHRFFTANPK